MTDAQLRDQAVAYLQKTTVTYPAWVKAGKPASSNWAKAFALLTQIGATVGPAPPVGPFQQFTSMQWDYDTANPRTLGGVEVLTSDENGWGLMGYFGADGSRPAPSPSPFTLHDLVATCQTPFDPSGQHGAGIWLGTWVNAERLQGTGPNEGIWTGCNCSQSTVADFTAKSGNVGLYVEHRTDHTLFQRFDIAGSSGNSVEVEWWYKGDGSSYLTFDTGRIYCPAGKYGVFLDAGTFGCQGRNLTFWGPGGAWAQPANLAGPDPNVLDVASCTFLNGGARVVTHDNPIG